MLDQGLRTVTDIDQKVPKDGYRTFLIVWFGQVISIVGSSLTWFGISIWVFLETGSVTQLAIVLLASQLPRILLSPIAGTFVDRWDRRWAMILSDTGAGVGTLVMAALYMTDNLTIPILAAIGAFSGAFQAFQFPAYQAATTLLVPKERYSRASGMVQLADAIGSLIAPALGGIMVAAGGLGLLIVIDVVTFVFAVGTLLFVRFPKPPVSKAGAESKGTVWYETKYGFKYIFERKGLLGLLLYFTGINFAFGGFMPIVTAYLLSLTDEATMGVMFSLGSTGMLLGAILASSWRGLDNKVAGIMGTGAILGLMMVLVGSVPLLPVIVFGFWIAMFVLPLMGAMSQAIWMAKVDPDVQGRVFAVRSAIAQGAIPISLLAVGPIADRVFVPLMTGHSALGLSLQGVFGSGQAAAFGLFFALTGAAVVLMSVVAGFIGPIRNLERDLPDVLGLSPEGDIAPEPPPA